MKAKYLLQIVMLLITSSCIAQAESKFFGDWEGKLPVGGGLRIVFHIKPEGNGASGTVDSPDQAAYGISCLPTISANTLTINMPAFNASFTGTMQNDSTIQGNFIQGMSLPLTLNRKSQTVAIVSKNFSVYPAKDIIVEVQGASIAATLFEPNKSKSKKVVLIIAGSGPTDRNGNSAIAGENNSLLMIADSLASHGIASLRYDKRGIAKSPLAKNVSYTSITINDMANDAKALYQWLVQQGYTSIYIAGHSEGSLIALMIANELKPAGIISISGAGRKAGEILKEQLSGQLSTTLFSEFSNDIDSLENGMNLRYVNPQLQAILHPSVQTYLKSWLIINPATLATSLTSPLLILQGTNDLQVKQIDAQRLHDANKKSKLVLIPGMNHILKVVGNDNILNQKSYADPSLPLSKELVTSITDFIEHH